MTEKEKDEIIKLFKKKTEIEHKLRVLGVPPYFGLLPEMIDLEKEYENLQEEYFKKFNHIESDKIKSLIKEYNDNNSNAGME